MAARSPLEWLPELMMPIGGFLCLGLGAAGMVEMVLDICRWAAARHWPVTRGFVVASDIEEEGRWLGPYTQSSRVRYTFEVGGHRYTGRRVCAGQEIELTLGGGGTDPDSAWSSAQSNVARYPLGTRADVYYDPANPKRCCLETGGLPGIVLKGLVCAGLLAIGALLIRQGLG